MRRPARAPCAPRAAAPRRQQDENLEDLSSHVVRIGELGKEMGQELHVQGQVRGAASGRRGWGRGAEAGRGGQAGAGGTGGTPLLAAGGLGVA